MKSPSLENFTAKFAEMLGTSWAFLGALGLAIGWLCFTTPDDIAKNPRLFVIELTGIFIFLHLFLIQRIHNKDVKAIHLKLDELIACKDGASNQLIKAETAPEAIIEELHQAYVDLAESTEHPTSPVGVKKEIQVKRKT